MVHVSRKRAVFLGPLGLPNYQKNHLNRIKACRLDIYLFVKLKYESQAL